MNNLPLFKNWNEIGKIGSSNKMLALELATINLASPNEVEKILISAFPSCFGVEEVQGPYPKSVFLHEVSTKGLEEQSVIDLYFKTCFQNT